MTLAKPDGVCVLVVDPDAEGGDTLLCSRWFRTEGLARAYVAGVLDGLGVVEDAARWTIQGGELEVVLEPGWSE